MVFEKVAKTIAEHISCSEDLIAMDSTFESLGIDSLDTVEMVMQLEEELGIQIELDQKLVTVGELVKFIEAKM